MTESKPDERRAARIDEDEPEVEAHRLAGPENPASEAERRAAHRDDDDEGPDVEGHLRR